MTLAPNTAVQEPVQEVIQEPVQEMVQEPVQEVVQEPVQKPVQEPTETVEETQPLNVLAEKLASFFYEQLLNKETQKKILTNVMADDQQSAIFLSTEINMAIITGLEKYSISNDPIHADLKALLRSVKANEIRELTCLTVQGIEKTLLTIREKLQELVCFRFVLSPENIGEYANLPEPHAKILIDAYSDCLLPENEPKGLEDYPSFDDYLAIITPKVLKATQGMNFETSADLAPHIPCPIGTRHSQRPVPARILEMINEKIWPSWKAANPPKPLTARQALDLFYSLHIRFEEEPSEDEQRVVEKTAESLRLSAKKTQAMLKKRQVTDECLVSYFNENPTHSNFGMPVRVKGSYTDDGNSAVFQCFHSNKPMRFGSGCVGRNLTNDYRLVIGRPVARTWEIVFDQVISPQSYRFVTKLMFASGRPFSLTDYTFKHLQLSNAVRAIKLLDLIVMCDDTVIRRPDILAASFGNDELSEEYVEMLDSFAPKTCDALLQGFQTNPPALTPTFLRNIAFSPKLSQLFQSRELIKGIFDQFVANPTLETFQQINVLHGLENPDGTNLIARRCFDIVAETIISKGVEALLEPASTYIVAYCLKDPVMANIKLEEYVRNTIFVKDINSSFVNKVEKFLPCEFGRYRSF